LARRESL